MRGFNIRGIGKGKLCFHWTGSKKRSKPSISWATSAESSEFSAVWNPWYHGGIAPDFRNSGIFWVSKNHGIFEFPCLVGMTRRRQLEDMSKYMGYTGDMIGHVRDILGYTACKIGRQLCSPTISPRWHSGVARRHLSLILTQQNLRSDPGYLAPSGWGQYWSGWRWQDWWRWVWPSILIYPDIVSDMESRVNTGWVARVCKVSLHHDPQIPWRGRWRLFGESLDILWSQDSCSLDFASKSLIMCFFKSYRLACLVSLDQPIESVFRTKRVCMTKLHLPNLVGP